MRQLRVAGAQLGPIGRDEPRPAVVARLVALLEDAARAGAELVVFPELALTTFFPRYPPRDDAELLAWFERAMPNAATRPLFERAAALGVGFCLGYAELTPEGRRFNTAILVDRTGAIVGKYRKVHLPGHAAYDPARAFQHLEKRCFEPGDLGFPVWRTLGGVVGMMICNDRRWPESWRVMGLQGVELVVLGYNTPATNAQEPGEGPARRLFHHRLSVQAGAYQNATWAVAVAKAGVEDGQHLIGGSLVVDPNGEIVAEASSEADEVITADVDFDACRFGKTTVFDFARHRRIEHYGRITAQGGAEPPGES